MTYSILARCPRTGQLGMSIATYTLAVGQYCDGIAPGVGITMSQASVRQVNNGIGLKLLQDGFEPHYVLRALRENDPYPEFRQIGVIDREGRTACHSGTGARDWKGHCMAPGVIAMGNVLLGPQVTDAMLSAYLRHEGEALAERLMRALEAGCAAGGQSNGKRRMPERSAAVVVFGEHDHPLINLRVDLHDHAVHELRRVYSRYQQYAAYYRQRDLEPANTPGQEVFEHAFGGETFYTEPDAGRFSMFDAEK
jgi:uncharacterized Ntn-hydrolase superfamily protein